MAMRIFTQPLQFSNSLATYRGPSIALRTSLPGTSWSVKEPAGREFRALEGCEPGGLVRAPRPRVGEDPQIMPRYPRARAGSEYLIRRDNSVPWRLREPIGQKAR